MTPFLRRGNRGRQSCWVWCFFVVSTLASLLRTHVGTWNWWDDSDWCFSRRR